MTIDDCFQPIVCGIAGWFLYEFRQMRNSIQSLNVKLGVIIEKTHMSEKRIDRMERVSISTSKGHHETV